MKKYIPIFMLIMVAILPCMASAQTAYSKYFGRAEASYYTVYNAFYDSLINYGVRPRLNAKTWFNLKGTSSIDTVQSWRRSAGNTIAYMDTTGLIVVNVARTDTLQSTEPVTFGPPLADFTAVFTDSIASSGAAADTSGADVVWWKYFSWDTEDSPSLKTGIYACTYIPTGTINPDSLLFSAWFDGTAAMADSGAIMAVVKNHDGTIISTGWKTVATASTWEHFGFVMVNEFTRNKEYAIIVYTKAVSGAKWYWTAPRFK